LISARAAGLAIRILVHGRLGLSYTNNLLPAAVREAVERARQAAEYMPREKTRRLAGPEPGEWPALNISDPGLSQIPEREKIRQALRIEASALAVDPRVTKVRGAEYEESRSRVWVLSSEGIDAQAETTLVSAGLEAVAEAKGEAQSGSELETVHFYDKLDVVRAGESAAKKAVMQLGSRPGRGGRRPVVLAPEAAAGLISALAPAASGEAVAKERSWLAGKIGKRIGSPLVTVVDDGRWEDGPGAFPFDDEGVPSRRTPVIVAGALENYLYNTYYGQLAGTGSTGNGVRPAFYLPPEVDSVGWMLVPGQSSEPELLAQVEAGWYITEFLGLHTVDVVTGDFSLGAAGFVIRKGRLAEPVTGIAMAGNLAEVLKRVRGVGDRLKIGVDAASPALLIEDVDLSGLAKEKMSDGS
jgi:PmbA protein